MRSAEQNVSAEVLTAVQTPKNTINQSHSLVGLIGRPVSDRKIVRPGARYCGRNGVVLVVLWHTQGGITARESICLAEKIVVDKPIPG